MTQLIIFLTSVTKATNPSKTNWGINIMPQTVAGKYKSLNIRVSTKLIELYKAS